MLRPAPDTPFGPDASGQGRPGYSAFMLLGLGAVRRPLGLLTLYQRGRQTIIKPMPSPAADADADAGPAGALVLAGLSSSPRIQYRSVEQRPRHRMQ